MDSGTKRVRKKNPNPDFHVVLDLILHKKVTTAHVMSPSGKKMVYALGKADVRKKARKVDHQENRSWALLYMGRPEEKNDNEEGSLKRRLGRRFQPPDLLSEEYSSDSEVEVGVVLVKRKKGGRKKSTAKKGNGCKPTKETRSKDLDGDEGNIRKKKSNSRLSTSMTNNQKGKARRLLP